MKLIVQDDALSDQDRQGIYDLFNNNKKSKQSAWIDKQDLPECLKPLKELAEKEFDISSAVGFELWTHFNTKPEWHYDKDEHLYNTTGELNTPLCSIAYYPYIDNVIGGNFITKDIAVKPMTNRVVVFSPGLYHNVEPYIGTRFSLLLNPWQYRLQGL
jgi:hypothetical protein